MELYIIEWIVYLNQIVSENISPYLPDTAFFNFFSSYPLYILIIFFVLTGGIALFMDFIKDAWKMPIAIVGDVLDVMAMQFPGTLDIIAALYSSAVFYLLARDPKIFRNLATGAVFVENIIGLSFPFQFVGDFGSITNVLPTNTVLMLIGSVVD